MLEHRHIRVTPGQTVVHVKGKPYKATSHFRAGNRCHQCAFVETSYCPFVPCMAEERKDNTNVIYRERIT